MKWKDKLISSSFPLEFEAAKVLVKNNFSVDSDYTYSRLDLDIKKDFSIDIHALAFLPYSNDNEIDAQINILVECKQRRDTVKWLFLPDPNKDEFSPFTLGLTLNAIDEFSMKFFSPNPTIDLDLNSKLCYKGIEIDIKDARVYDSEIRHGLHQLQYALPRILKNNIVSNMLYSHEEDNYPFFLCPILLTSASLYVANKNLSTKKVITSSRIEDFAKKVPYLITYLDYGPDFEEHCIREFESLNETKLSIYNIKNIEKISSYREQKGEYVHRLPKNLIDSLQNGNSLKDFFTQFIVCDVNEFPNLIKEIKKITLKATKNITSHR